MNRAQETDEVDDRPSLAEGLALLAVYGVLDAGRRTRDAIETHR